MSIAAILAAHLLAPTLVSPAATDSTLYFEVDFARFCINENAARAEIYIAVPRYQLQFATKDGQLTASFECQINISLADSEVIRHRWVLQTLARDSSEIKPGQLLFTQASFRLPVADYDCLVTVSDPRSGKSGSRSFALPIEAFSNDHLCLSDLEISTRIIPDTIRSRFYKNHYTVIPNPGATFGVSLPMVYVYAEIYNLAYPSDSTYSVHYRVLDGQGNLVKSLPARHKVAGGSRLVEVGGINVASLPGGSYYLQIEVIDHATQEQVAGRRKFYVYRETGKPPALAHDATYELLMSQYRNRTEAELDKEFETLRYISGKEERKVYSSLGLQAKRDFLVRFWLPRDRSPETPRNEYRDEYLARVKYANENFSGLREGWQTDRGRVLLLYGVPDDIERYPSSSENRPYQVWRYFEIEGGVEFVFVDIDNWGEYQLVHSTARAELSDVDWERWLNPAK